MKNYIGPIEAEWVDRAVELPPDGWRGMIVWKGNGEHRMGHWSGREWRSPGAEPFLYYLNEIVAWLRIGGPSDAVPRAKVQAAVDEITKYADEIPGTRCARGLRWARHLIATHTSVTPSGVL